MKAIICALSLLLITPEYAVKKAATVENHQGDCTCCPAIASVCPFQFLKGKRAAATDSIKQVDEAGSGKIKLEEEEEREDRIADAALIGGGPRKEKAMV